MKRPLLALIGLAVFLAHCASSDRIPSNSTEPGVREAVEFRRLGREYLDAYYRRHPVRATQLGIHDHDDKLPDLRRTTIERTIVELHSWRSRLSTIDRETLPENEFFDHIILDNAILAELLQLEETRDWQRNPMEYNRIVADGMASIVDREFAALELRLRSLIRRIDAIPRIIAAAKANLRGVPRLWAELALRNTRGTVRFLSDRVEPALVEQGLEQLDEELIAEWKRARQRGVERLQRFGAWQETELLPRADGEFRLGREQFTRKLRYEEYVSQSVEELWELNQNAIRDYQQRVTREASRISADRSPAEVMLEITGDHPASGELISSATRFVSEARKFVVERDIVSLPSDSLPTIRPTPEFARSGFASMSSPGPFEDRATEAFYNISDVDPTWSERQKDEHLTYFNYPGLLGISVHEVMPGHYVQQLYRKQVPGDIRKVFMPASFVEGWAHYCEEMMVDEGLGDGAPEIRLGQLRRALQRHARWDAGLAMHVHGEALPQVAQRFERIAFFAPFPALRETQRGTYDPTYLYYAWGRMEILRLREDYRRHLESRGERFTLREFHDRLLRLGLPIPLARRALLEPRRAR